MDLKVGTLLEYMYGDERYHMEMKVLDIKEDAITIEVVKSSWSSYPIGKVDEDSITAIKASGYYKIIGGLISIIDITNIKSRFELIDI